MPAAMAETEETVKNEKPPAGIPTGGFLIVADHILHDMSLLYLPEANGTNKNNKNTLPSIHSLGEYAV